MAYCINGFDTNFYPWTHAGIHFIPESVTDRAVDKRTWVFLFKNYGSSILIAETFSSPLVLWCGIGEKMKISFLFIATFVYFLPSVLLCFDEVPAELLDVGRSLGLQERHIISQVVLPMSLPSICNTFLMMYGIGWTYCAIVEASNAKYGLGYIIEISAARGRTSIVFAAIIMIMIFSYFFDKLGNWLIHKIFSWRY